ncbi:hypothetical protein PINS_up015527 [Pythium insidiosum]|nr:hypothetical protein PINS_up015527 [Pythium insidiosum]
MTSAAEMSTLEAIRLENQRLMEEIQKLVVHNTKRQRELLSLNEERDQIVAEGHEQVRVLTDELKQLDSEYASVKMECDRLISVICAQTGNNDIRQALDLTREYDVIEEEDAHSDHSTVSSGSTASSSSSSSTLSSLSGPGRPPMPRGQPKKMSIDIDLERMEMDSASPVEPGAVSKPIKKMQSMPMMPAASPLGGDSPTTAKTRPSSRSDQNSFRLSQLPPQHRQHQPLRSPMLAYKAHSVLKTTQAHLNNFRRHSGSQRKMKDTVAS